MLPAEDTQVTQTDLAAQGEENERRGKVDYKALNDWANYH